jgi:allantoate deiminase
MRDRARRAISECKHIATMSEEPDRITRRFLTPPVHQVHAHLRARMEAMGMTIRVDAAGNLCGLWQPAGARGARLIMGSHIDTVPNAGAYDGILGVALALEWVALAQELALPLALEVIAFSEEEGVRFGVPFIGSRVVAGRFDTALLEFKDSDGVTMEQAILDYGLDPHCIAEAAVDDDALGFVEIHVEQGPVLDSGGLSVAAVSAIMGQTRLSLKFTGQANHAGTTPMRLRRDALTAAAEWVTAVETYAIATEGLVATIGKFAVDPNASNVIPGVAQLSLDVRHPDDTARNDAVDVLLAKTSAIGARRGLTTICVREMDQPAVPMDERLTAFVTEAIDACGFRVKTMPSGAGHDAMVMAARMPAAMLFLRSPGGISHHPAETVLEEDVEAALHVGRKFLQRLTAESR